MAAKFSCPNCRKELFFVAADIDESVKCVHCDHHFAVPKSAKFVAQQTRKTSGSKRRIDPGVRGWLLWFCIYNGIFLPAGLVFLNVMAINKLEYFVPMTVKLELGIWIATCAVWIVHAYWVIYKLFLTKPRAAFHARVYVIASIAYIGLIIVSSLVANQNQLDVDSFGRLTKATVHTVFQAFLWFVYFKHSERVQITYKD